MRYVVNDVQPKTAFLVVDRDGVILLWGGDAYALTGHDSARVVGNNLNEIVPPDYQERHWNGFRTAMTTGKAEAEGVGINLPVHCADGTVRRFPTRITIVRDAHGHAIGAAAAIAEPLPEDPPLFEL